MSAATMTIVSNPHPPTPPPAPSRASPPSPPAPPALLNTSTSAEAAPAPLARLRSTRTSSRSRSRKPRPSRSHSPAEAAATQYIPGTSLYTYPSHSSLASLYRAASRASSSTRDPSPAAQKIINMDEVKIYTAVIPPVAGVAPSAPLPPTPPPGSPQYEREDEEDDRSDVEELLTRNGDSPRLRRVRGSVGSVSPSRTLDDDECVVAGVGPARSESRRGSVGLHHPKNLKGSPKSAYFQDGFVVEGQMRRDSNTLVFEDLPIRREARAPVQTSTSTLSIKTPVQASASTQSIHTPAQTPPESEVASPPVSPHSQAPRNRALIFDEMPARRLMEATATSPAASPREEERQASPLTEPETPATDQLEFVDAREAFSEDSDGGVLVSHLRTPTIPDNETITSTSSSRSSDGQATPPAGGLKPRIFGRANKAVSPWPTPRAMSYDPSCISSPPSASDKASASTDPDPNPGNVREPRPISDTFVNAVDARVNSELRRASLPASVPAAAAVAAPFTAGGIPTRTFSESRHRRSGSLSSTDAARRPSAEERPVIVQPAPAAPAEKLVLPPPPVFNIIPATPSVMSPAAEADKQLGHGFGGGGGSGSGSGGGGGIRSLLRRRATGISTPPPADVAEANEEDVREGTEAGGAGPARAQVEIHQAAQPRPRRPSITAIPQKVRESKLHPWWRPKRPEEELERLERVASDPSSLSLPSEDSSVRRRASLPTGTRSKKGRVQKRILGTNLVVEFIGWRAFGAAIKKPLLAAARGRKRFKQK